MGNVGERTAGGSPAEWLQREYLKRREKNARYSLRAFSNYVGIPAGRLCELLNEKRRFTPALIERAAERLGSAPEERERLLAQARRWPFVPEPGAEAKHQQIRADEFELIAEWHHFAILSLLNTKHPPGTSKQIGTRLGISAVEAHVALNRLRRLGHVTLRKGRWSRTSESLRTAPDVDAAALRRSHRQTLEQAIATLEEVPRELRSITSLTMAIDPKRLEAARRLITRFESEMEALLEAGERLEVYNLNIQLVPVSKIQTRSPREND